MNDSMNWYAIAIGAITLLMLIGGWIWTTTISRIEKIADTVAQLFEKLDTHVADDTEKFSNVLEKMNEYHIETLNRISGRWHDRDRED